MKVGIFFKVNHQFLVDAVEVEHGEIYGVAIQHGGHYELWENLVPKNLHERQFKLHSYDYYPRGRVVYFIKRQIYRLYLDPCFIEEDIYFLLQLFDLINQQFEIAEDEHYRCARCNPYYLD